MTRLHGKVAIVTGAARGIGRAQAAAFAAEGACVVMVDVRPEGRQEAEAIGGKVLFVEHDVTDESGWAKVVALAEERFGSVDILVNTAGIAPAASPLAQTSAQTFMEAVSVNALGVFLGMKAVVEPMTRAGGGAIVNVVSTAALGGGAQTYPYVAGKWAARGLTKAAAAELAPSRIRVNAIFPGPVATDMLRDLGVDPEALAKMMTPVGFPAEPWDIAAATVFLASDEARYIYGAELTVDGGSTI